MNTYYAIAICMVSIVIFSKTIHIIFQTVQILTCLFSYQTNAKPKSGANQDSCLAMFLHNIWISLFVSDITDTEQKNKNIKSENCFIHTLVQICPS